jgi:1-acyl-sn-glycerol-3-phosphate acyltransferase
MDERRDSRFSPKFSPRFSPRFSPGAAFCFEALFAPWRRLKLGDVRILNLPASLPPDRPVVLIGNHISNWDGFVFRAIQKRLRPGSPLYSVMLEAELRRYPFIRRLGGIGIDPLSAASVASALRAVRELRRRSPDFCLSYFPQGRIFPSFKRPLGFRAGIDLFIRALAPATLIPVGLHMEPMRKLAPTLFASLGRPMRVDRAAPLHMIFEDLVQSEIDKLHHALCMHGEAAAFPANASRPPPLSDRVTSQ